MDIAGCEVGNLPEGISPTLAARLRRLPTINGYAGQRAFLNWYVRYASECRHITSYGVFDGVDTTAYLCGLIESKEKEKRLLCVDINPHCPVAELHQIALEHGISFEFKVGDSRALPPEYTDMAMIDTYHNAEFLRVELEHIAPYVNKYILLHDTDLNAFVGDIDPQTGRPGGGLFLAIGEFLCINPHWGVERHFPVWPGLTILSRRSKNTIL